MNLSTLAIHSVNFCFIYFEAMLLDAYKLAPTKTGKSSWGTLPLCRSLILLFPSRNASCLRATVPKLCTEVLAVPQTYRALWDI